MTVLVIKENEMVLTLAGDILREFGYRLLAAGDADGGTRHPQCGRTHRHPVSGCIAAGDMNGVQLAVEARHLRSFGGNSRQYQTVTRTASASAAATLSCRRPSHMLFPSHMHEMGIATIAATLAPPPSPLSKAEDQAPT